MLRLRLLKLVNENFKGFIGLTVLILKKKMQKLITYNIWVFINDTL